jgi:hypothetical protein
MNKGFKSKFKVNCKVKTAYFLSNSDEKRKKIHFQSFFYLQSYKVVPSRINQVNLKISKNLVRKKNSRIDALNCTKSTHL